MDGTFRYDITVDTGAGIGLLVFFGMVYHTNEVPNLDRTMGF